MVNNPAAAGRRRAHLIARWKAAVRRAWIGRSASQRSRSSARASAEGYRRPGDFSRHFRTIVSRSRSISRVERPGPHGLLLANHPQGFQHRIAAERRPAGEQLEQDRPQRVHVDGRRDRLAASLGLFGRHVAGRAHDRARLG